MATCDPVTITGVSLEGDVSVADPTNVSGGKVGSIGKLATPAPDVPQAEAVSVDPFDFTPQSTVPTGGWGGISVSIPSVPGISIPSFSGAGAEVPETPALEYATFENPEYGTVTPLFTDVEVTLRRPDPVSIPELSLAVSVQTITLPDESVEWAYQAYVDFLVGYLDQYTPATLLDQYDAAARQESAKSWRANTSLAAQMGYADALKKERESELRHNAALYESALTARRAGLEGTTLKLLVEAKFSQQKHVYLKKSGELALQLPYQKAISEQLVAQYNMKVADYANDMSVVALYADRAKAIVERNAEVIRAYAATLDVEKEGLEINRRKIAALKEAVALNEAVAQLFASQMAVAEKLSRINESNLETYRTAIQGFATAMRIVVYAAQGERSTAELTAMNAEAEMAPPLVEEMSAQQDLANAEIEEELEKFTAQVEVLAVKQEALAELAALYPEKGQIEEESLQVEADALYIASEAKIESRASEIDVQNAQLRALRDIANAEIQAALDEGNNLLTVAALKTATESAKMSALSTQLESELTVAEKSANAKVCAQVVEVLASA
ncbi:MAG: hypothetical protein K8I29_19490 [Alphaproteobacteria bacterium]|uniref:Uncharacterized protein n=1 Tax=Candidatus Nitrobium versatile TaxID=2884831 RepID=A0A953M3P6_9BACT|nr:hypothetical protein [Candidatus Nitrobium versatile]